MSGTIIIEALEGAKELIRNEPFNPSGYFLLGSIYQTIAGDDGS